MFAEKYLLHAEEIKVRNKIILNLPLDEQDMDVRINEEINKLAKEHNLFIQNHNVFKIDHKTKIIQVHVFYNNIL